jgi:hypothetical protein
MSVEDSLAYALFGWELNIKALAEVHLAREREIGAPPRPGEMTLSIPSPDRGVREVLRILSALPAPLDARLSVVLTAQSDDGSGCEFFRLFVAVGPLIEQQIGIDPVNECVTMSAPLCLSVSQLRGAVDAWIAAESLTLPETLSQFAVSHTPCFMLHNRYTRYNAAVYYANGALQNPEQSPVGVYLDSVAPGPHHQSSS